MLICDLQALQVNWIKIAAWAIYLEIEIQKLKLFSFFLASLSWSDHCSSITN